jgi:hypothetical protein
METAAARLNPDKKEKELDETLPFVVRFNPDFADRKYPIDQSLVHFEIFRNCTIAGIKPNNPTVTLAHPTGPIEYAFSLGNADKYLERFPEGVQVHNANNGLITLKVTKRKAATAQAVKAILPDNVINNMSVDILCPHLGRMKHLINDHTIPNAFQALGFEVHRPHWQSNTIKNSAGDSVNAGFRSAFWLTLLPAPNFSIFGSDLPPALRIRPEI